MKKYRGDWHIKDASGFQTYEIEANSPEEALKIFKAGDGRFVEEHVEVTDSEEMTLDDVYEAD